MLDIYKWFLETASKKLVVRILLNPSDVRSQSEADIFIYLTNSDWVTTNGIYDKYHFKVRNYKRICRIPEMVDYTDLRSDDGDQKATATNIQAELDSWRGTMGWVKGDQLVVTGPTTRDSHQQTFTSPSLAIRMHLVEIHYWVTAQLQKMRHGSDPYIPMSLLKDRLEGLINDQLSQYTNTIDILEMLVESETL